MALLGFQRAAGRAVVRDRGDVETRRQFGEGASARGVFRQVEQGGGGGVQSADRAVSLQRHDRDRGQGGVEHGLLGGQSPGQVARSVVQRPQAPAELGQNPCDAREQGGVGQGVRQAFARHQGQVDGDGQGDGQCRGRAARQHGGDHHGGDHGQVIELAQTFEQASEDDGSGHGDDRQQHSAPASTRYRARKRHEALHRRWNGEPSSRFWIA
ncbi:hypothetical protein D3C86_1322330 [compost metagenome]